MTAKFESFTLKYRRNEMCLLFLSEEKNIRWIIIELVRYQRIAVLFLSPIWSHLSRSHLFTSFVVVCTRTNGILLPGWIIRFSFFLSFSRFTGQQTPSRNSLTSCSWSSSTMSMKMMILFSSFTRGIWKPRQGNPNKKNLFFISKSKNEIIKTNKNKNNNNRINCFFF